MACHAVQMWSLSGLVAAFLDLTIAYLLLCASSAAYIASKFLGFFGLNLPCPCDGMFINVHSRSLCFNRLLIDFPIQKLSDVHLSVRQKFPFSNSASPRKYDASVSGDNGGFGIIELEGNASCSSSISDSRGSANVVRREISSRTGKIDVKGKGVLSYRPKTRLCSRKGTGSHGRSSSLLSCDSASNEEVLDSKRGLHINKNKRGSWCSERGSLLTDNSGNHNLEYDKVPKMMRGRLRTISRDEIYLSSDEDKNVKESVVSGEERQYDQLEVQSCGGYEKNKIRVLEQALERERVTRASLYIELEKERRASASAADEAMAMILRLQEEKASIEMEARQYQRIIEEKSAYDDEEMDIIQEILMRREKEKLFLEKEVETYREMVFRGNEQSTGDCSDGDDATQMFSPPNHPNDDPFLFQDQLAASSEEKVKVENKSVHDDLVSQFKSKPTSGIESPFQPYDEQSCFESLNDSNENSDASLHSSFGTMDLQEKVKSPGKNIQLTPTAIPCHTKGHVMMQKLNQGHKLAHKVIKICYETEKSDLNYNPTLKQQEKDAPLGYCSSTDPTLGQIPHDVHVIGDGINLRREATADKGDQLTASSSSKVREMDSVQSGAAPERKNESFVKKISLDLPSCLPPISRRSSLSLRRSSMSSLDNEMLKIDSEIVQLEERLKRVQEGKEKLNFSFENQETKPLQLKILEDIAQQIQEIRYLNEPQKAARQASLPLLNSKDLSKRRRSRSVSSGFRRSSEG
ncbi:uncharacterized protein LOC121799688 [Salvia splendens]|uniref:uncharacterized protein LOC121799688 n=1 Tax=Salvia splendens TaxID=180675 RepID=UPI001C27643E|nr:uncharacterized protein LOC121799688 [Salvia splendens]XP_042055070.1 uncharacterized protein LOC121799688 [Salvia splendens]